MQALKEGARGNGGSRRFFQLKNVLVMVQVAVSVVLLVAGGLLGRGFAAARSIDVGLDAERVAALPINLEMQGYGREEAEVFWRTLRERAAAIPGAESASVAVRVPFDLNMHNQSVYPDVLRLDSEHPGFSVDVTWIDPEYFETIGASLLQGRNIRSTDIAGAPRVAVVSAAMAKRFWGDADVVLLVVAFVASYVPAARAARLDPLAALRQE